MDCSPPGSSVHGILQAGLLEWVAMPSSRVSFQPKDPTRVSYVSALAGRVFTPSATMITISNGLPQRTLPLCLTVGLYVCVSHSVVSDSATPWTVACQAPLSMEFSRQEYWNGLPFPSPGDLPDPGMESQSPALQADSSHHLSHQANSIVGLIVSLCSAFRKII